MTQLQSFCFYLNTVLLLIITVVYIARGSKQAPSKDNEHDVKKAVYVPEQIVQEKPSSPVRCEGRVELVNVEEEVVPVILAGLSASLDMPISALNVKSIKRI